MKALKGGRRIAFYAFFASHIVIAILCDVQAILKPYYPRILQDFVTKYADLVKDPHMSEPFDLWFQSFVFMELIFQLPFFFVACHMLGDTTRPTYPRWFQMLSIVYGSHTATTLIPILPTILFRQQQQSNDDKREDGEAAVTLGLRILVVCLYFPYFAFPAWFAYIAATDHHDDNHDDDDDNTAATKKKTK